MGLAEHVGGVSNNCMTNGLLLSRGLELPAMLREDMWPIWTQKTCISYSARGNCTTGFWLRSP